VVAPTQALLVHFQLEFPKVDLALRQTTAHGAYLYNLHLVLVHDGRWREIREQELVRTRNMVLRVAAVKKHRVSRLALLADQLHMVLGVPPVSSPEEIALAYLNNLAYTHGMQAVFSQGYYVGTVGDYDSWAIRRAMDGPL
jgi:REP element-mobilizing transposase RayT